MSNSMSLKDVARLLGVKAYRIEYLLSHEIIAEPAQRVSGRRVFMPEDVQRLAAHFGVKLPGADATAEPAAAGI